MVSIVINLQVILKTWTVIVRTKQNISLYSLRFYIIGFHFNNQIKFSCYYTLMLCSHLRMTEPD
jgi:hypothetical protein